MSEIIIYLLLTIAMLILQFAIQFCRAKVGKTVSTGWIFLVAVIYLFGIYQVSRSF